METATENSRSHNPLMRQTDLVSQVEHEEPPSQVRGRRHGNVLLLLGGGSRHGNEDEAEDLEVCDSLEVTEDPQKKKNHVPPESKRLETDRREKERPTPSDGVHFDPEQKTNPGQPETQTHRLVGDLVGDVPPPPGPLPPHASFYLLPPATPGARRGGDGGRSFVEKNKRTLGRRAAQRGGYAKAGRRQETEVGPNGTRETDPPDPPPQPPPQRPPPQPPDPIEEQGDALSPRRGGGSPPPDPVENQRTPGSCGGQVGGATPGSPPEVSSPYPVLPPIGKAPTPPHPAPPHGGYLLQMEKKKQRTRQTHKAGGSKAQQDQDLRQDFPEKTKMERQRLYSDVIRELNKKISRIPFPPTKDPEGSHKKVPRMKALEYAKTISKPLASQRPQKLQPGGSCEDSPFWEGSDALEQLRKRHLEEKQAVARLRKMYAV